MVSWDKICRPKQSGGLGIRKMEAVNSTFLSKLTWKLFNQQCLWTDQMLAKYPVNENFFTAIPRKSDSWVRKCIRRNRRQFCKGITWKWVMASILNFGLIVSAIIAVWQILWVLPTMPILICPSLLRILFCLLKSGILSNCRASLIIPVFKQF